MELNPLWIIRKQLQ